MRDLLARAKKSCQRAESAFDTRAIEPAMNTESASRQSSDHPGQVCEARHRLQELDPRAIESKRANHIRPERPGE